MCSAKIRRPEEASKLYMVYLLQKVPATPSIIASNQIMSLKEGGSSEQLTPNNAFCDTEAIIRRILPPTILLDQKAIDLIDKCVLDFASSVTTIAAGYSLLDESDLEASRPQQMRVNELKSEHVLRTVESMGFVDFVKPLNTYKMVLKNKLPPLGRAPPSTTGAKTAAASKSLSAADGRPSKKAKTATSTTATQPSHKPSLVGLQASVLKPTAAGVQGSQPIASSVAPAGKGVPHAAAHAAATSTTTVNPASVHGAILSSARLPITAKELKDRLAAVVDCDLLTAEPPMTEFELAAKHNVNVQLVLFKSINCTITSLLLCLHTVHSQKYTFLTTTLGAQPHDRASEQEASSSRLALRRPWSHARPRHQQHHHHRQC